MTHRRVRPACVAAVAFAALALSPGSAGAHPADCAGASVLTPGPITVSFADWTVDCTHATATRGSADSDVEQAGAALEKVVMWSYPVIKDGLIYVVDLRNGLYVLKSRGAFKDEVERIRFLDGNSNQGDALCYEPVGRAPRYCN